MIEKKYGPGTQLPNTRLNKKTPQYVFDYLEKHQPKSADLMRLIQLGIEVELNREQYGLFIPYAPLSKEQIRELETNEVLKVKFMQFAKWFFFTEGNEPPPFVSATVKSTESMAANPADSKNTPGVAKEKQMDEEQWLLTNEYMHLAMQHLDDDDDD
ncbi:hypothetical protein C1X05_07030 [Laceyella sacchari]|uniref:hypothetical protein n=1 Tax=Laceyella tengchongensis TaxID=574699 RepID=UPI000C9F24DA|nr:hypothetical protein C1X05_07030 [Laceyella sacchari]MRG28042.1 hypothetical protein [Laceyella tengchongensis]